MNISRFCLRLLFHCFLFFFLSSAALGASGEIARFSLKDLSAKELRGPYGLQDGARMKLGGAWYYLDLERDLRMFFRELYGKRVFGPFDFIEGRLIGIGDHMYEITQIRRGVALVEAMPELSTEDAGKNVSLPLIERLQMLPRGAGVVLDIQRQTSMDWSFDDYQGSEKNPLIRNRLSLTGRWGGLEAALGYSFAVSFGEDLVEETTSLPKVSDDTGDGYCFELAYTHDLFEYEEWKTSVSLRGEFSHDDVPMRFTSLQSDQSGSNGVQLVFLDSGTDLEIEETSVSISLRISYAPKPWGVYLDIREIFYSSVVIDGGFTVIDEDYSFDAERRHPVTGSLGGWYENQGWRTYAEIAAGSDIGLRLGLNYTF